MLIGGLGIDPVEGHVLPGPHARQQVNAQERGESKDRFGLAVGIGVQNRRLESRAILEQAVQDIDGFPDAAGDKVAEERNIRIANMMIGLSEQPSYAKEFTIIQF